MEKIERWHWNIVGATQSLWIWIYVAITTNLDLTATKYQPHQCAVGSAMTLWHCGEEE